MLKVETGGNVGLIKQRVAQALLAQPARSAPMDADDVAMTFHSRHRPLESYFLALEEAGLMVETLREPRVPDHAVKTGRGRRWQRLPLVPAPARPLSLSW